MLTDFINCNALIDFHELCTVIENSSSSIMVNDHYKRSLSWIFFLHSQTEVTTAAQNRRLIHNTFRIVMDLSIDDVKRFRIICVDKFYHNPKFKLAAFSVFINIINTRRNNAVSANDLELHAQTEDMQLKALNFSDGTAILP